MAFYRAELAIFCEPKGATPLMQNEMIFQTDPRAKAPARHDEGGKVRHTRDEAERVARPHDLAGTSQKAVEATVADMAGVIAPQGGHPPSSRLPR